MRLRLPRLLRLGLWGRRPFSPAATLTNTSQVRSDVPSYSGAASSPGVQSASGPSPGAGREATERDAWHGCQPREDSPFPHRGTLAMHPSWSNPIPHPKTGLMWFGPREMWPHLTGGAAQEPCIRCLFLLERVAADSPDVI